MSLMAIAARRLLDGGLVAFPTETVYGLGADAENPVALARIYAAKGRPSSHPVIVHVTPDADLCYWAASVPAQARALIQAFWPGPLTLILPKATHIPSEVSGGQDSIGLRCPSHPVAQALLREFSLLKPQGHAGIAAPSANKFGQVSPTHAEHVRSEFAELDESQLLILEGGPSQVGIESTIVDLSRLDQGIGPTLLRPGHVSAQEIAAVLGVDIASPDAKAPQVSGSLKAHYAPHTPLSVLPLSALIQMAQTSGTQRIAAVVFKAAPDIVQPNVDWEVCSSDPAAYARDLYAMLRRLDQLGYARMVLEQPPDTGEWQAVNDRLGRAAAAFD